MTPVLQYYPDFILQHGSNYDDDVLPGSAARLTNAISQCAGSLGCLWCSYGNAMGMSPDL